MYGLEGRRERESERVIHQMFNPRLLAARRKLTDNQSNFIQDDMCESVHAFNHVEMFNANNRTLNNAIIRTVQTNECYSNDKVLSSIESVTIRTIFATVCIATKPMN